MFEENVREDGARSSCFIVIEHPLIKSPKINSNDIEYGKLENTSGLISVGIALDPFLERL
ncbi:MAG: hypothetical protein ACRERU_17690 [Methylococcales bacterium]